MSLPAPRRHFGVFLLTAALVFCLDMVTKAAVVSRLHLHEDRAILGDVLRLTYIHNTGAAFGMFAGARWTLVAVSLLAVGFVIVFMLVRPARRRVALPLGLVLGGALGNLVDRIRMGQVVDFLNLGVGPYRWPVFNCADVAVTVGVLLLGAALLAQERQRRAGVSGESHEPVATAGDDI